MLKKISVIMIIIFLIPFVAETKELVITTLDNPPQAYLENGVPKGFLVEVVSNAVNRSGFKCIIKVVPWRRALKMVKLGTADAVFNAGYTKERSEYLYYPSNVLVTERVVALRRKGSNVFLRPDLCNAKDFIVGVGRGFFYGNKIQKAIDTNGFKRVEEVPNIEFNARKLKLARIDLFFADYFPAMKFLSEMENGNDIELIWDKKTGSPVIYATSDTYLAFSKNITKSLADRVNDNLLKMKSDGTYDTIVNNYISTHKGL